MAKRGKYVKEVSGLRRPSPFQRATSERFPGLGGQELITVFPGLQNSVNDLFHTLLKHIHGSVHSFLRDGF